MSGPVVMHFGSLKFKEEAIGTGTSPFWACGPRKGLGVRGKCKNQECDVAKSPYTCMALYSSQAESNYHLKGDLPLCPVCRVPFQPISLYFHDCDMYFALKMPDQEVCKEGPFHCPKGKWSVLEVREVDPIFTVVDFELGERPPELKEGMSDQEKQQACQQIASVVAEDEKKITEKYVPLTCKEKLALKRQAAEAAKAQEARAKKLESAETDLKRVDETVDKLKPAISEAKSLADLDAPAEAIDSAKQEAQEVATQRDELVQEMKTEQEALAEAQTLHAVVMQTEEVQLQEASREVEAFQPRAQAVLKSLRSFLSRTFSEATRFFMPGLFPKAAAAAAAARAESENEQQVQDSIKAVEGLLATLRQEHEESKHIRDTLEQLRASLAEKETRVNNLSEWVARVFASLDALEAELDAKIAQFDA